MANSFPALLMLMPAYYLIDEIYALSCMPMTKFESLFDLFD